VLLVVVDNLDVLRIALVPIENIFAIDR